MEFAAIRCKKSRHSKKEAPMIQTVVYLAFFIIDGAMLYYLCSSLYELRFSAKKAAGIIGLSFLFLFAMFQFHNMLLNCVLDITVCFLVPLIIAQIDPYSAFFNSIILSIGLNLSEMAASVIGKSLLSASVGFHMQTAQLVILGFLSRIIYIVFVLLYVFLRKKHITLRKYRSKYDLYYLFIPMLSALAIILIHSIEYKVAFPANTVIAFSVLFVILTIANVILVRMYDSLQQRQNDNIRLQQEIQKKEDYNNYNKLIEQQDSNQKIIIHDIKNHLISLRGLLADKNYTQAEHYLDNLLGKDEVVRVFTPTNSRTLNLLLSRYIQICKEKKILFRFDVNASKPEMISDADITALVCNLMDNAIESAEQVADRPYIDFKLTYHPDKQHQLLTVENSSNKKPAYADDGLLTSTKQDSLHHGYGIRSITASAKKYNGSFVYKFDENEKCFYAMVLLKMTE